jgi:hypothetical protein
LSGTAGTGASEGLLPLRLADPAQRREHACDDRWQIAHRNRVVSNETCHDLGGEAQQSLRLPTFFHFLGFPSQNPRR